MAETARARNERKRQMVQDAYENLHEQLRRQFKSDYGLNPKQFT
jgi:hypothetical protein